MMRRITEESFNVNFVVEKNFDLFPLHFLRNLSILTK